MQIQFQQRNRPTPKQIWRVTGKKHIMITAISRARQPYELSIWTIYYDNK